MKAELIKLFQKGSTVAQLKDALHGKQIEGRALTITVDPRSLPYLNHIVDGWVDGPPPSNVEVVFSAKDPKADKWRRFSLSRKGSWRYEIDVFPTPFNNSTAPLSPGSPPGASRAA